MNVIDPTSVISSKALLGNNVKIGPYCIIGDNVEIGDNCLLTSNVYIDGFTKIGNGNKFYHSAVIGSPPQDLKYDGSPTKLIIGDNNIFREFVTVNTSATLDEDTTIGNNCLIMAYCHVAHNCHIENNIIMANAATLAGHITLESFVTIGGLTPVHQFVRVGQYSFIGGASGVKKDVPPFVRGDGIPFIPRGLNSVGLSRRGFSEKQIEKIKDVYKLFYASGKNVSQALQEAEKMEDLTDEQKIFINFIKNSERGIAK